MKKVHPLKSNTKWAKVTRTTVTKKMLTQSQIMFRHKRSGNISEYDDLQNIQEGIITGFGIKSVEHKE